MSIPFVERYFKELAREVLNKGMKRFAQYYVERTFSEMGAEDVEQQMAAKVQHMADTMRKLYPAFAARIDGLLQNYNSGQMDIQQLVSQAQQVSGMTKKLGTAFGGAPQGGASPMEQPTEAPAAPAQQGNPFTGGNTRTGPMLKQIRRRP